MEIPIVCILIFSNTFSFLLFWGCFQLLNYDTVRLILEKLAHFHGAWWNFLNSSSSSSSSPPDDCDKKKKSNKKKMAAAAAGKDSATIGSCSISRDEAHSVFSKDPNILFMMKPLFKNVYKAAEKLMKNRGEEIH